VKLEAILFACLMTASTTALAEDTGSRLFEPCRACHSLDPAARNLPGPNLAGLSGRKIGGDNAFDYSPVLRKARVEGLVWDEARLDRFLADPDEMFPGFWMTMRRIEDTSDRSALVRFLVDPASR
jgi:cytochrome c